MSTGQRNPMAEGALQIVPVNDNSKSVALPPRHPGGVVCSGAIVEYIKPMFKEEEEDLEIKLRRIIDNVPVRVSNTSGSSAGSGSGDFHQYRQMRRKEQDRLARMEVDYQKRKEVAEFLVRKDERQKATEDRTTKKREKRQKKKQRKREKKRAKLSEGGELRQRDASSDNSGDSDADERPGDI